MIGRHPVAAALVVEAFALAATLTLVADFRAHRVSEQLGGVNIWGYRGPVMLQKAGNETRIAVVGGDLAFGWGVAASETLAPNVRLLASIVLDAPGGQARRVTAVNLGALGLPPSGYAARLDRYRYLNPDVTCVYVDAPRAGSGWAVLPREDSAVFAWTGYAPMLPLVLVDKGVSMRSAAVAGAGRLMERADAALFALFGPGPRAGAPFLEAVAGAVHSALASGRGVVAIVPPYAADGHDAAAHMELLGALASTFRDERRLRVVDLGDVPELADPALRLDGINFSAGGHAKAAGHIAPAVLDLIRNDSH